MLIKLRQRSVPFIEQEEIAAYSNISCSMRAPEMEKMWLQLVYRCLSSLNDGGTVFRRTCKLGLVSKRKDSAYRFGRSPDWLKMKSANAPAVKREAVEEWTSS
jgi:hypothetical protein